MLQTSQPMKQVTIINNASSANAPSRTPLSQGVTPGDDGGGGGIENGLDMSASVSRRCEYTVLSEQ